MSDFKDTPLTDAEIAFLTSMLDSHDRAGFYLTYGSMIAYADEGSLHKSDPEKSYSPSMLM